MFFLMTNSSQMKQNNLNNCFFFKFRPKSNVKLLDGVTLGNLGGASIPQSNGITSPTDWGLHTCKCRWVGSPDQATAGWGTHKWVEVSPEWPEIGVDFVWNDSLTKLSKHDCFLPSSPFSCNICYPSPSPFVPQPPSLRGPWSTHGNFPPPSSSFQPSKS